jgi:hypothetical protein
MSPAEKFIPRLPWSKKVGQGRWIARCPAHKDRSPSLTVTEKEDGKLLLNCHAECDVHDVVGAVGLQLSDLFPPRPKGDYRPPDRTAVHAADILAACADELTFAFVVINDEHLWLAGDPRGQPAGPATRARFAKTVERILAGASMATGRHINADQERRAIIAAGMLTEAEEIDLAAFPTADLGSLVSPVGAVNA